MAWYRTGTVSVTNGSATVTGSGTDWINGIGIGEAFYGPDGRVYEIANVTSATSMTIGSPYLGTTQSSQAYQIIPSQSYIRDLAAQAAQLVSDYAGIASNAGTGKFADGTLAAPGVRFTADENTGVRRAGNDDMRLVAAGADQAQVTSAGLLVQDNKLRITGSADATKVAVFEVDGFTTATTRTFTLPNASTTVVGTDTTQTLTNKTLTTPVISTISNTGTLTLPTTTDTLVGRATTDTLTNKTLTSPVISGGTINNASVGATTPSTGAFTTLTTSGNVTLGDAATDTVTVNGFMGVGGAPNGAFGVHARGTAQSGTTQYGFYSTFTGSTSGTNQLISFASAPAVPDSAYTVGMVVGLRSLNPTKGASATVTNLHGVYVDDQTQGVNNFGVTSIVSSGTNKWNIYASGTAANHFAGQVLIGTTSSTTISSVAANFQIRGATAASSWASLSRNSADVNSSSLVFGKDRAGATVVSGDSLGSLQFSGFDGSSYLTAASVVSSADAAVSTGIVPGRLVFNTANTSGVLTERLRITSAGNVGINNNNPTGVLHIVGADPVLTVQDSETSLASSDARIRIAESTAGGGLGSYYDLRLNAGAFTIDYDAAERLRIDSSGNVGIGTNAPGARLEVLSASAAAAIRVSAGVASTTTGTATLRLQSFNSGSGVVGSAEISNTAPAGGQSILTFSTSPSGNAPTERLRIDSAGTVNAITALTEASSPVVVQSDIGTAPNEIPLNQYLGSMAYEDHDNVAITGGVATLSDANVTTLRQTTEISSVEPTLNLNFARSKVLDPRITFTRASEARYYDGRSYAKAEENLFTFSQEIDNAAWVKLNATVSANAGVAPDGTSTADKLAETADTGQHRFIGGPVLSATSHTVSVFLKAAERGFAFLSANTEQQAVSVNLTTGAVTTVAGSPTNVSSVESPAGSGWWRVSFTFTGLGVAANLGVLVSTDGVWANRSYTGTTGSGILIWGAQLEQRSTATAYTPTTTAPITNYIPQLMTAPSGVARFDHNPLTGESLGLLIEEQRTNLVLRSAEFNDAGWTKTNATVSANAVVAPDGTLTADALIATSASGRHVAFREVGVGASNTGTVSCFAKAGGYNFLALTVMQGFNSSGILYTFDLSTGAASQRAVGGYTNVSATATSVGNGWWRCSISFTNAAATSDHVIIAPSPSATPSFEASYVTASYTGDGFSGIYIWGAQLEAGAFPTSYIPTAAAQATRNVDLATMTGTNFSSWYRADEGTLYGEWFQGVSVTGGGILLSINDGTASTNRILIASDGTNSSAVVPGLFVNTAGVAQASTNASSVSVNTSHKMAGVYKRNDFASSLNGAAVVTDTDGVLPVVTQANIGTPGNGSPGLNGHIRKLAYFPVRLPNAELQEMTV